MNINARQKLAVVTLSLWVCGPVIAHCTNSVFQWDRFEASLINTNIHADPYRDVTLNVTYTRPDASVVSFWGFYDDNHTWRIRFMPDQIGTWSYSASFSDGAAGANGSFECVTGSIPGLITADETNPRWFGFKGGQHVLIRSFHVGDRFFATNWPATNRTTFLDWAQAQGYNMLAISSHYLNRATGERGLGWNTPDLWDGPSRSLNAAEYQKMETILDDLAERQVLVYPFAGFFGKASDFPTNHADQEFFVRYTLARVGPYWNLLFNVAGPEPLYLIEADQYRFAMGTNDISRLGNLIKSLDVFGHLLSEHNVTDQDAFKNEPWEDYMTFQGQKTLDRASLGSVVFAAHGTKPLYALEVLWPGNTLGHPVYSDTDIRKNGFVLMMSAAALNFGDMAGHSSSGFSGTMNPADKIQTRHDIIKRVWDFFEAQPFYRMSPRPDLVNNGWCLAEPGREYLVYLQSTGRVSVAVSNGPYQVEWINAQNTQDKRAAAATSNGQNLSSPADGDDWLLHLVVMASSNAAPPTLSGIADQTINEDTSTGPLSFTVGDVESAPGSLTLSGGSSNPALVPTSHIVFGGSGSNRMVTVSPAANANGSATITVRVSDGELSTSTNFVVVVNAVSDAPTLSSIANQTISVNGTTGPLSFTLGDVDTPLAALTLSAGSSNPAVVPTNQIALGGSGSNRTVTVTPTAGQSGTATITVSASDGELSASNSFVLTVTTLFFGARAFTNAMAITIPDQGAGTPYPSTLEVSGMGGPVSNVTVTLWNLSHTWTSDLDVLLLGPAGQKVMVMSDAGSGPVKNITLAFSDTAASVLPPAPLTTGTFRPINYVDPSPGGDNFPNPAPAGPYETTFSAFNGASANGSWALYVLDDGPGDLGSFAGGWSLTVTTSNSSTVATPPQITSILLDEQGTIQVTVRGEAGFSYAFEASSNLINWTNLAVQDNLTGSVVFSDQPTTNRMRFYRVGATPKPPFFNGQWSMATTTKGELLRRDASEANKK